MKEKFWAHPRCETRVRLLQHVPHILLVLCTLAIAKLFFFALPETLGLLAHFLVHVLLPLMVLVLTARLQVELVDAPVLQVVAEGEHTHLVHQVQLARPVEVEDGAEALGVSVEEVFVVYQRVVVAELCHGCVDGGRNGNNRKREINGEG